MVGSTLVAEEKVASLYPRKLRQKELDLLASVLPEDRPGYRVYRELLSKLDVIGDGRRGAGDLVLGVKGDRPDLTSPLPPVVAHGVVETTRGVFSISVREFVEEQMNVEIVSTQGTEIPDHFEEKRRWTYSTWSPQTPSPATGEFPREVHVSETLLLAIFARERRLLLHDTSTGINHLIPVTHFHNELMLCKSIRDPRLALNPNRLFENLPDYGDGDLRTAFIAYNNVKHRVSIPEPLPFQEPGRGGPFLKALFRKRKP
jgi:hypothetical protein